MNLLDLFLLVISLHGCDILCSVAEAASRTRLIVWDPPGQLEYALSNTKLIHRFHSNVTMMAIATTMCNNHLPLCSACIQLCLSLL